MANMKTLHGLLEFIAVVECGTFTGAARQLGVSVSHISRQIADLEHRLQAQMFVRTTRQMQLTEPGNRLFKTCQPLLEEVLQAQENVVANQEMLEGVIRISLAGKFAEEQLVPALTRFCVDHPAIELDIDISARNVDLLAEGFHLAVRVGPLASSTSLITTKLLTVPMRVLASPRMIAGMGSVKLPEDLDAALCLPLGERIWRLKKGNKQFDLKPAGRFASNSGAAMVRAAIDGLGIIQVPAYYATGVVESSQLLPMLDDWDSVDQTNFYLVYPASHHMASRVRTLIDYLRSHFLEKSDV
jgi:DNA-binding transcriptional LysR family regulator